MITHITEAEQVLITTLQPTTYDPDLGVFLKTFNIRFVYSSKVFEVQIKATSWIEAEYLLHAIKATGTVHSELLEVLES